MTALPSELSAIERETLLDLAEQSLRYAVEHGRAATVDVSEMPDRLQQPGASFVTLRHGDRLRGCMGSLVPRKPLGEDASDNAYAAGFQDPRFEALQAHELAGMKVSVAVLGPREPVACESEAELFSILRPNVDGVVIHHGQRSATLLPSAWALFAGPREFLQGLLKKVGLPKDYWSGSLRFERYQTESVGRTLG